MPTYIVKPEKNEGAVPVGTESKKEQYPRVYGIQVSPEIIEALEIGQSAVVTLTGKVVSLSENQSPDNSRCSLELELRKVEAYPSDEEKEEVDVSKEMKAGIKKRLGYKED